MPRTRRAAGESEEHGLPSLALVFGYIAVKDLQSTTDRIAVLNRLGYGNQEMALICGTDPHSIAALKHQATKTKRKRP
jgi:hypothetical protein